MRLAAARNLLKVWALVIALVAVLGLLGWAAGGYRLLSTVVFCALLAAAAAYWYSDRVASFLEDVLRDHPDETVLIVTHGGSARVVYALASGLDYVRDHGSIPPLDNCAVVRYAVRDGKLAPVD